MNRIPLTAICLLLSAFLASGSVRSEELTDLHFGEALYFAKQGLYFEALERLDSEVRAHTSLDEPELDSLFFHIDDARFSLGDFELRYRMHHRAGRAIRSVLEGDVDEVVRNDAAYRLARIHFQKNQLADAMHALDRIDGRVPDSIRDDIEFLRANILLAEGRAGESITVLKSLQSSDEFSSLSAYNLGIAFLQNGQHEAALTQLARAGDVATKDPVDLAIRDKSNLVLGTILLEDGQYDRATPFLNRVRLDGPYSNRALLSAGWANMSADNYERAVVPWKILAGREVTDRATQEAMLALPYAYGKMNIHGRAAIFYGTALDSFGAEVEKLGTSIESIREGRFLDALTREEIRTDKDWIIRLRSLPDAPETYYLMDLLATHDFQTGLQNYLDLSDLRRKLAAWDTSFDAFDEMVDIRRAHYEPLLPDIDHEFRKLDSRIRLRSEQHAVLIKRREDLLRTPRPEFLATRVEQEMIARIDAIEDQLLDTSTPAEAELRQRADRLMGLLVWTLRTEYHDRLTAFDQNLRSLDQAMVTLHEKYDAFVRARQAATHSYMGYTKPVGRLRTQTAASIDRIDMLLARQGRILELVAIDELVARRDRLEGFRDKARFALADSYDRATREQQQAKADSP